MHVAPTREPARAAPALENLPRRDAAQGNTEHRQKNIASAGYFLGMQPSPENIN